MKFNWKKLDLPQKLFLGLCALQLLVNLVWIVLDTQIPAWDQAGHTRLTLEFVDNWAQPDQNPKSFWQISSYYPPFIHWQTAIVMRFFGRNPDWGGFVVTAYCLLLSAGIYKLSNRLWRNRWLGLLAATLVAFMPVIYTNSRWFLLDISLLAFTVWSWYFLWQSDFFTRRRETILFALTVAAVLLTKWTGVVFLAVPLIFVLLKIIQKNLWSKVWRNLCLAFLIVLILISPWYITNFRSILAAAAVSTVGEMDDPQVLWSLENWRYYLWEFLGFQVGLIPGLAMLTATIIYFCKKDNPYRLLFGSFLIVGYVIFSFLSNKDIRYDLPLLVPIAMLAAATIIQLWQKRQKIWSTVLLVLTVGWLGIFYFVLSFNLLPDYQKAFNFGPFGWLDVINTTDTVVAYPQSDRRTNALIIEDLVRLAKGNKASVLVGIDQRTLSASTLHYWSQLQKFTHLTFIAVPAELDFADQQVLQGYLNNFDYFIFSAQATGVSASRALSNLELLQQYLLNNSQFTNQVVYEGGDGKIFLLAKATQS
ncbi:MAG: phospholipid carrier-dependent glycosyltransferase [bacterium]|nr:phospholipid carrier-dependent glycosyltransferase [bacterium]